MLMVAQRERERAVFELYWAKPMQTSENRLPQHTTEAEGEY
jgi:hypothetical protein